MANTLTAKKSLSAADTVLWAYDLVLERRADDSGLHANQAALENGSLSVGEMVRRLATSDEFKNKIAAMTNYGVNGEWIPGAPAHRVDVWTSDVGAEAAQFVHSIDFYCTQAGPSADERLRSMTTQIVATSKWIAGPIGELIAIVG